MPTSSESSSDAAAPSDFVDVAPTALVQIGFVFRAHGMEGELKINPEHTDDPARFEELDTVYAGRSPHQVTRHTISSVRYQQTKRGTTLILGLADIENRSDAEEITKLRVFAREDDLELGEDEVFIHDLVGLTVVTEEGEELGTVANYKEMPAQDVFVVRRPNNEEAMIPAVEEFIIEIDIPSGKLVVRPVDGLIDSF
jgi:16S rRNA processing protein RimM